MIEPVDLQDFVLIFFSTAAVIIFGLCYAIFFALSALRHSALLRRLGYASFVGLLIAIAATSRYAHFDSLWLGLSFLMAAGYFWAPRLLLKLSQGTHNTDH